MRTTLKLVLPLAASVVCVSLLYSAHQVRTEPHNLRNDLSYHASVLAENFRESLESNPALPSDKNLTRLVERHARANTSQVPLSTIGVECSSPEPPGSPLTLTRRSAEFCFV